MTARSTLRGIVLRTGALAAGYAGLRWVLNLLPGSDRDFFEQSAAPTGDPELDALLPAKYYRTDAFAGVFTADDAAIRAALPTPELNPVHLPGGRALVMISAFNYLETSIGPYGEVMIAVPCVLGHDAPPLLPLLLEARYPGFGFFVLHLPVTSQIALEGGRRLANYPKFIGDMDFERQPSYQRVRLAEGDRPILTLTVSQRGLPLKDNRPVHVYTARDPDLIKTAIPACSVYQVGLMPGWGRLELGSHPIAGQLRGLGLGEIAFLTRSYLSLNVCLPGGTPVARLARAYDGHTGRDLEQAHYTIRYAESEPPVDLYANHKQHAPLEA